MLAGHLKRCGRIIVFTMLLIFYFEAVNGLFEFSKEKVEFSKREQEFLENISTDEWLQSLNFGTDSVDRQKRFEDNLVASKITVQNGSLSHTILLDTLPNSKAQADNEIALKILKSSVHVYNTKCLQHGITALRCSQLLKKKELPKQSPLAKKCAEIVESPRDGHHPFRRLLSSNYVDSFYEMYNGDRLPAPRNISSRALPGRDSMVSAEPLDEKQKSLALVQWAQFIEHDVSKTVATSMSNGESIECCNKDNYSLLPRYRHTACAPLLSKDPTSAYGRDTCLNYVRSALAIGSSCTFGAAEQLNQATGYLDLSQLYGFTTSAQMQMRSYKNGQLKSTPAGNTHQHLLPMADENLSSFCAFKTNMNQSLCFMAGDSRVNSNPFAIAVYTIFLRNHNQIAQDLKTKYSHWDDEQLFKISKAINIDIYRRIVFNEWLAEILGADIATAINTESFRESKDFNDAYYHVSNEFAVAAMRFYFSMMPNVLYNFANNDEHEGSFRQIHNNDILPDLQIFVLRDQLYKPNLVYSSMKLDEILESLLHQRAMKMDATYAASLIPDALGNVRPTHADILAFDIQRGRDHGLQPYVKYLEACNNIKIKDWSDLTNFISEENIVKMRKVYANWTDIDLIVGGISENSLAGTVGPTFTCILGEQFSKMRQWQHGLGDSEANVSLLMAYKSITAADLLCANSDLKKVPKNIFRIGSNDNPLISCADRSNAQR